jgi:hypothetical protein
MPSAVNIPARRESDNELRDTMAKSGPGLMTAKMVMVMTARSVARASSRHHQRQEAHMHL